MVSMAYFCLTMLEGYLCKGRKRAADTYAVDYKVLAKVGDLTANKGGRSRPGKRMASIVTSHPKSVAFLRGR